MKVTLIRFVASVVETVSKGLEKTEILKMETIPTTVLFILARILRNVLAI